MSDPHGIVGPMSKAWDWLMDREPIVVMLLPAVAILIGGMVWAMATKQYELAAGATVATLTTAAGGSSARERVYTRNTLRRTTAPQVPPPQAEPASVRREDHPEPQLDQSWEDVLEEQLDPGAAALEPDLFFTSEADHE